MDATHDPSIIEFYPDDTVTIPLWNIDGLLPDDPAWLERELGLSPGLIEDLAAWSRDWDRPPSDEPSAVEAWLERQPEREAEGERLFTRLQTEISPEFSVVKRF